MISELEQFIEENIDLIDDNEFNKVYNKINSYELTKLFTEEMLESEINPLNYMEVVPTGYLCESNIQHIDIPVGIVVNNYAFAGCRQIKEVTIPEGVIKIGECAFYKCNSLEVLHLPSTLKYIDTAAFGMCRSLKEVTFAGTVKQWIKVNDKDGSLLRLEPIKCSDNWRRVT